MLGKLKTWCSMGNGLTRCNSGKKAEDGMVPKANSEVWRKEDKPEVKEEQTPSETQNKLEQATLDALKSSSLGRASNFADRQLKYKGAPKPANEEARMTFLRSLEILDTAPEEQYDKVTTLLTKLYDVPICLVSLVDDTRQWFKSAVGLPVCSATDRNVSFCAWTLLPEHPEVLVVEDATNDARFKDNNLVTGELALRFYAGAPLVTSSGHRLGSLCILDKKIRLDFDAESCNILCNFARLVVEEIEGRQKCRRNSIDTAAAKEAMLAGGAMFCDTSKEKWEIMYANTLWGQLTGIPPHMASGRRMWDIFAAEGQTKEESWETYRDTWDYIPRTVAFSLNAQTGRSDNQLLHFTFKPAANEPLNAKLEPIAIPAFVASKPRDPKAPWAKFYFSKVQAMSTSERASLDHEKGVASGRPGKDMRPVTDLKIAEDIELQQVLRVNSTGTLHKAMWSGEQVAVKVIEQGLDEPECLEAEICMTLLHPNVAQTFLVGNNRGEAGATAVTTWLVREMGDRGSLQEAVESGWLLNERTFLDGTVNMEWLLVTAIELAGAMCYLHSKSVVHGDLDPVNIILVSRIRDTRGYSVKIADFGKARMIEEEEMKVASCGSINFQAPELLGSGVLSKAADVFSFGVLLWQMYTGTIPWVGLSNTEISYRVSINERLEFPPGMPASYQALVGQCWSGERSMRPAFPDILFLLQKQLEALQSSNN